MIKKLLLTASEGDPKLADKASFREAYAALGAMADVGALRDQAARLYHDPKIQALAGDKLDWYLAHPAAAVEKLRELERTGELPAQLAYDARLCFEEPAAWVPRRRPLSRRLLCLSVCCCRGRARARLISKGSTGRLSDTALIQRGALGPLTAAEEGRLTELAGERAVAEGAITNDQLQEEIDNG